MQDVDYSALTIRAPCSIMPLIALQQGQQIIIVDRGGHGNHYAEIYFSES